MGRPPSSIPCTSPATIHVRAPLTIADGETVQLDPGVSIIVDSVGSLTSQGTTLGVVITAFNGTPGGMAGIRADSGSTLSLTGTAVSHGSDSSDGPSLNPARSPAGLRALARGQHDLGRHLRRPVRVHQHLPDHRQQLSNNTADGLDIGQSVGGSGGSGYQFILERNTLDNNGIAGRIFSNAIGNIDDNHGSGNTTNALFLNGNTFPGGSTHINGNTIPLGLDTPPGGGAPTLNVPTASILNIGAGQTFLGRNHGSLGTISGGAISINGTSFDSLHGTAGEWGGILALNGNLTLTNTTINHGSDSSDGPSLNPAQVVCQSCALSLAGSTISGGTFAGLFASTNTFQITDSSFSNNTADGLDIGQSVGGSSGSGYQFILERNTLDNNGIAGRIFSNAIGNIDDNHGSGNTTNALFLNGNTFPGGSTHINGNTIPLGLDTPPGGGAPTLNVPTASILNIGAGQTFLGRNHGSLGTISGGAININGTSFDSLHGTAGEWGGSSPSTATSPSPTPPSTTAATPAAAPASTPPRSSASPARSRIAGSTISGGTFAGLFASTNTFQITDSSFSNNTADGIDISQSVGGSSGSGYQFILERNTLDNNGIAGRIFSNAIGNIDDNHGSGNTTNALFLNGNTFPGGNTHINGNTIPLGLDTPTRRRRTHPQRPSRLDPQHRRRPNLPRTQPRQPRHHQRRRHQHQRHQLRQPARHRRRMGRPARPQRQPHPHQHHHQPRQRLQRRPQPQPRPVRLPDLRALAHPHDRQRRHLRRNRDPRHGDAAADHVDVVGNTGTGIAAAGSFALTASIVSGSPTGLTGAATVGHSDLTGTVPAGIVGVNGNIALDPLFAGPADFHLRPRSPAIGTDGAGGDMGAIQSGLTPLALSATGTGVQVGHGDVHVDVTATGSGAAGLVLTASVAGANPHAATALAATDGSGATSFSYTPTSGGTDTVTVFYDENGNGTVDPGEPAASVPITITADNVPPVPDVSPLPEVDGQCSATVPTPTATDAVTGHIVGTTPDPTSYTSQGTFTVHWSYDDGNGNVSHQDQSVVVHDTIAPVPDAPTLPTLSGSGPSRSRRRRPRRTTASARSPVRRPTPCRTRRPEHTSCTGATTTATATSRPRRRR